MCVPCQFHCRRRVSVPVCCYQLLLGILILNNNKVSNTVLLRCSSRRAGERARDWVCMMEEGAAGVANRACVGPAAAGTQRAGHTSVRWAHVWGEANSAKG